MKTGQRLLLIGYSLLMISVVVMFALVMCGVFGADRIAEFIFLAATDFENKKDEIKAGVKEICDKYPLYE